METLRPANYPVPAIRRHKLKSINGAQQQQQKIISNGSCIAQKIDHVKPVASNLSRNSPVTKVKKPTSPIVKKPDAKSDMLSDDDEFYAKLSFDDTEQSLEDEIFEELEKVAHDEAKLNAAIQNFDKILSEYKTKEVKKTELTPTKPSAIPKPLQKSKTCSIIESKCILKKKQEEKKVNKPIRVENVETVTHAGYYQITKSLWNLEDFDNFAKSAKHSPASRKSSEGTLTKAKSVWEVSGGAMHHPPPRPSISRQSSISKIPIKSSYNLSTSMLQLNSSSTTIAVNQQNGNHAMGNNNNLSSKKKSSNVYASTLGLSSPTNHQSSSKAPPPAAARRSSLVAAKSSSSLSNYAETKASLQRRNLMNSKASLLKPTTTTLAAKSEMSIHGKFAMKAQKIDQPKKLRRDSSSSSSSDALLDKCLVKGQELLRKVEEFNDGSSNATKTSIVVRKRDYIAKTSAKTTKLDASMNTKLRSSSSVNANVNNEINAITNEIESNKAVVVRTSEAIVVAPTLESREVISEVVLGAESQESIDKLKEDYESDDSGHISNENEEVSSVGMELKKAPRKISEELLEIFEKKSPQQQQKSSSSQQLASSKAKVIELNHVNLIKSSMEIYPTCKSEVTIFIKPY